MDIVRAKGIVRTLADGVDPMTGEALPDESVYNFPQGDPCTVHMIGNSE